MNKLLVILISFLGVACSKSVSFYSKKGEGSRDLSSLRGEECSIKVGDKSICQVEEDTLAFSSDEDKDKSADEERVQASLEEPKPLKSAKESFANTDLSSKKLDILFVLDSNRENFKHLKRASESFAPMFDSLKDVDWQMAFITSNHGAVTSLSGFQPWHSKVIYYDSKNNWKRQEEGKYGNFVQLSLDGLLLDKKVLSADMDRAEDIFAETLFPEPDCLDNQTFRSKCNYTSQPLKSLNTAVHKMNEKRGNKGFLRKGSELVVIVVSPQDEAEGMTGMTQYKAPFPLEASKIIETLYKTDKNVHTFGVYMTKKCAKNSLFSFLNKSKNMLKFVNSIAGVHVGICEDVYSDVNLSSFSKIEDAINKTFTLSHAPLQDSLKVETESGRELQWSVLEGRTLRIKKLKNGEKFKVSYQYRD